MDEKFASLSSEARIGETVKLVATDVMDFAKSCQQVIDVLDNWLVDSDQPIVPIEYKPLPRLPSSAKEPDYSVNVSKLAQQVGLWIAKHSKDGRSENFVKHDAMLAEFADQESELADAIAELELEGLVNSHSRGHDVPYVRATIDLFATFDKHAIGSDPYADAVELTKKILDGPDQLASAELHTATGWEIRRFNPALSLVVGRIDSKRVSAEISSDYPSRHFFLLPIDRAELKRFLKQAEG